MFVHWNWCWQVPSWVSQGRFQWAWGNIANSNSPMLEDALGLFTQMWQCDCQFRWEWCSPSTWSKVMKIEHSKYCRWAKCIPASAVPALQGTGQFAPVSTLMQGQGCCFLTELPALWARRFKGNSLSDLILFKMCVDCCWFYPRVSSRSTSTVTSDHSD